MTTERGRARAMPRARLAVVVVGLAALVAACAGSPTGPAETPAPTDPPRTLEPGEPQPGITGPPAAALAVDGGDPVVGQLGTWTWGGAGSSAPWLRGAPLAVGRGETLALELLPAVAIESWTADFVPAAADGPRGATELGSGRDAPRFAAPPRGDWTVVVRVVFAGARGSAAYAWAVSVR